MKQKIPIDVIGIYTVTFIILILKLCVSYILLIGGKAFGELMDEREALLGQINQVCKFLNRN